MESDGSSTPIANRDGHRACAELDSVFESCRNHKKALHMQAFLFITASS